MAWALASSPIALKAISIVLRCQYVRPLIVCLPPCYAAGAVAAFGS